MALETQIQKDIMEAMKAKDTVRLNAVRSIKSGILLAKTAEGASKDLTDSDIIKIIQKLAKQRKEAAEQYSAAGRQELADNELAESKILETYLPKQLSEAEVEAKNACTHAEELAASASKKADEAKAEVSNIVSKWKEINNL